MSLVKARELVGGGGCSSAALLSGRRPRGRSRTGSGIALNEALHANGYERARVHPSGVGRAGDDGLAELGLYGGPAVDRCWKRRRTFIAAVLVIRVVAGGTAGDVADWVTAPILGTGCTAVAEGRTVTLDAEQASSDLVITAVAVQLGAAG